MTQSQYDEYVARKVAAGDRPVDIARELREAFPEITVEEAAVALRQLLRSASRLRANADIEPIDDLVFYANLLASYPDSTPLKLAVILKADFPAVSLTGMARVLKYGEPTPVYPGLPARDLATTLGDRQVLPAYPPGLPHLILTALRSPGVFPAIGALDAGKAMLATQLVRSPGDMSLMLTAAGYPANEVATAMLHLYPPAPPTRLMLKLDVPEFMVVATWDSPAPAGEFTPEAQVLNQLEPISPAPVIDYGVSKARIHLPLTPGDIYSVQVRHLKRGVPGPYSSPQAIVVPNRGPRYQWRFAEGTGTAITNSGYVPLSGALAGNVSRRNDGPGGKPGVEIDGSKGSFVSFTRAPGEFGIRNFTVMFWIRTQETLAVFDVLGNRILNAHDNFFSLRMSGNAGGSDAGHLTYELDEDRSGRNYVAVPSTRYGLNDGKWHHIACVRDGVQARLFTDGVMTGASASAGVTRISSNNQDFRLGQSNDTPARYAPKASFADMRIYDFALPAEMITAIFKA